MESSLGGHNYGPGPSVPGQTTWEGLLISNNILIGLPRSPPWPPFDEPQFMVGRYWLNLKLEHELDLAWQ